MWRKKKERRCRADEGQTDDASFSRTMHKRRKGMIAKIENGAVSRTNGRGGRKGMEIIPSGWRFD